MKLLKNIFEGVLFCTQAVFARKESTLILYTQFMKASFVGILKIYIFFLILNKL